MNNLSILIYIADTLPTLSIWAGIFATITITALVTCWFMRWMIAANLDDGEYPGEGYDGSLDYKSWVIFKGYTERKFLYFFAAICIVMSVMIPSQRTIYMIAASESGEAVVNSPEAKEIFKDIMEIIDGKLEEFKTKK